MDTTADPTSYFAIWFFLSMILAVLLGLIPANIARSKGRSFGTWWLYGWAFFLIAFIHALSLPYPEVAVASAAPGGYSPRASGVSPERRQCPQCAEYIMREAKICRFCGYDMAPVLEAEAAERANLLLQDVREQSEYVREQGDDATPEMIFELG